MVELDDIVLAFAIKDKKHTMELVNSVDSKYFKRKQWIFNIIKSHFVDPKFKEIPTFEIIKEKLEKENYQKSDLERFLKEYSDLQTLSSSINSAEFTWNLDKLRTRYNSELQRSCAENLLKVISSDSLEEAAKIERANKIVKETVSGIDSIYRKQVYREGSLDESAKERFKRYSFIEKNPEVARGVLTGFKQFDRITNGLHPGEFMVIAGETGTGKSILMHNIGVNAYLGKNSPLGPLDCILQDSGHNVLYFSLEMPKESIERRIDSCMGGLYYNQLRDGALSEEDKKKYFNVLKFQTNYQKRFHIVDMPKGATTREIELKYVEVCENKFKPDLVIIDYIGIMSTNDNNKMDSDWLALGQISAELHEFSRVYNVPTITGSQVNRPKEAGKQEYSTNRIARSGMLTTNANVIIQIGCREDEYLRTDIPIYIVKMRDGEKGAFTLSKNFAKMKVLDMEEETFADSEIIQDDSI